MEWYHYLFIHVPRIIWVSNEHVVLLKISPRLGIQNAGAIWFINVSMNTKLNTQKHVNILSVTVIYKWNELFICLRFWNIKFNLKFVQIIVYHRIKWLTHSRLTEITIRRKSNSLLKIYWIWFRSTSHHYWMNTFLFIEMHRYWKALNNLRNSSRLQRMQSRKLQL